MPRTHGRLYEKWTIPDWLDVPAERHESLGAVLTRLKIILKGRIYRKSEGKKEKKHYEYPNESVLLLAAHWTSSLAPSKSVMTTSSASMSTIRP